MMLIGEIILTGGLILLSCALTTIHSLTGVADISPFRRTILDRHNEYRRNEKSSNMRTMEWDTSLARRAQEYSKQCRYERSKSNDAHGENLYFESGYAKRWHSRRKMVRRAINNWHREKQYFRYGKYCGSACSFVQMIMAETYRIGCGLNRCSTLGYGRRQLRHVTLFVCFYSPRGQLIGDYPYERGAVCSRCPINTQCRNYLCASRYSADSPSNIVQPKPPRDSNSVVGPILSNHGPLSKYEKQYVLQVHNHMREEKRLRKLEWNKLLELWASYVIRCDVEYPGPRDSYSNFGKIDMSQAVQNLIYEWVEEGDNVHVHLNSGCRTPADNKMCNHNSNIMEASIKRIGCAAKACDRKRQLTCIYDDRRR